MHDTGAARVDGPATPGGGYLGLLAEERKLAIVQALEREALPGAALASIVQISERRVRVHVRALLECALIERVRSVSPSHRVAWRLSDSGRELLALHELILGCEQRVHSARAGAAGSRPLLQTICHPHVRAILWALARDSRTLAELERELAWVPRSTLAHGLEYVCQSGLVRACGSDARRPYELLRSARGPLGLISLAGVCWRLRFTPGQRPWNAGDLLGLLVLLAPVVRVAVPGLHGICLMQVLPTLTLSAGAMRWPDALVPVLRGRIAPRPAGPTQAQPPDARLAASDTDWCEALLDGGFERIETDGDRELAYAVLQAVVAALRR